MDKIIRIDVSTPDTPSVREEPIGKYVGYGGRAITTAIVHDEVPPTCHALGGKNKIVFAPGLLAGTASSASARLSVGCKSPLTGRIQEANAGGEAARHLARLNIAAIIIEGAPALPDTHIVSISQKGVRIETANEYKMLPNYTLCEKLGHVYDQGISVISIGPAGEMKMSNSSVAVTDPDFLPTRQARRGGVGAVMGAKNIKCIVIDPTGTQRRLPIHATRFKTANKAFLNYLEQYEVAKESTSATEKTSWMISQDHKPFHPWQNSGSEENELVPGDPGSRVIWAHGEKCGISDLDMIDHMAFMDNNYGFDCVEMGLAISLAMKAGVIQYGNHDDAVRLIEEAAEGTPLGRILGSGVSTAAQCFGLEHSSFYQGYHIHAPRILEAISMGKGGSQLLTELSYNLQVATAILDSTGFCLSAAFAILEEPKIFDAMVELINAMFDLTLTGSDLIALGKSVLRKEHEFNQKAGFAASDDPLPAILANELLKTADRNGCLRQNDR